MSDYLDPPTSWFCPHCAARLGSEDVLFALGPAVPHRLDLRRHRHLRLTTGEAGQPPLPRPADWRLLEEEEILRRNGTVYPGESHPLAFRCCPRCHMPVSEPLFGAKPAVILTNDPGLRHTVCRTLDRMSRFVPPDTLPETLAREEWAAIHTPLYLNYAARLSGGVHWLTVEDTPPLTADPGYLELLRQRFLRDADGYLLLLQIDGADDNAACEILEELLRLHGSSEEIRKKSAAVLLVLPPEEPEPDPSVHSVLMTRLSQILPRHILTTMGENALTSSVLSEAIAGLAAMMGLAPYSIPSKAGDDL